MDLEYWRQPERTREEFMAKLSEEVGEVANEMSRILKKQSSRRGNQLVRHELEHVMHVCRCWWEWIGDKEP